MKLNFKNKLFVLFISFFIFSIPIIAQAYSKKVYLGGENIGIEVNSKGVLVVGYYEINGISPGKEAGIKLGDIIINVNNKNIHEIVDLTDAINNYSEEISITYIRNNTEYKTTLKLVEENNIYKTGLYIKDKIIGIGTLTFIDENNNFFALGHEITEKNTKQKFEISDGIIFKSIVTSIDRSENNNPGEKNANYYEENVLGEINKNTASGILGKYTDTIENKDLIEIAENNEITTGKASIITVIDNDKKEEFEINIIKINKNTDTKNILFEVTDKKLLEKTNGIVQGMSGSPIIQNNKIIGAVTHVVVENPNKGYGILISNMLKEIEN